jgi:hypothetical protein
VSRSIDLDEKVHGYHSVISADYRQFVEELKARVAAARLSRHGGSITK